MRMVVQWALYTHRYIYIYTYTEWDVKSHFQYMVGSWNMMKQVAGFAWKSRELRMQNLQLGEFSPSADQWGSSWSHGFKKNNVDPLANQHSYGRSRCSSIFNSSIGKSTINGPCSIAMLCYVGLPESKWNHLPRSRSWSSIRCDQAADHNDDAGD